MELRDLIVTPILLFIVYALAYYIRPFVTNELTRRYFIPALTVRIFGALAVGLIYQFYYGGGDTFGYHTHGSRIIWDVFAESPAKGLQLMLAQGNYVPGTYEQASRIWFFDDPSSYFIVRLAAIFDIFTFSSYSATAVLFAVLSFSGGWVLFFTFYRLLPGRHGLIAIATLFIPSVFFWGAGILKDSVTVSAVGWATYAVYELFIIRRFSVWMVIILLLSGFVLFSVKLYILLCFLPAAILWVFLSNVNRINSLVLRLLVAPVALTLSAYFGYQAVEKVAAGDKKYALENITRTARITAHDIGFYTGRSAGSRYSLGELDGTLSNMLSKAPLAINVTLFRPYLWEVNNPLMLISALESFLVLLFTIYVLFRSGMRLFTLMFNPVVFFCLVFSIAFAFAVGVSTYNFGTLVRYKIPLLPFYLFALIVIAYYSNREKNAGVLEVTE